MKDRKMTLKKSPQDYVRDKPNPWVKHGEVLRLQQN